MMRLGAAANVAISPTVPCGGGIGRPAYFRRAGLYSKVSIWLTPPSMNRKMQRFALAGMCWGRTLRGSMADATSPTPDAARAASEVKTSSRARPPRPRHDRRRN